MKFTSLLVPLPIDNIDTDQIIPARYLKTTTRQGLGKALFADWRPNPGFALNRPEYQSAQILLAGANFGCGSSREHAPWALAGYGIKAIISTSFADIFKNNALKNGLLPIVVDKETLQKLFRISSEVTINLAEQSLVLPTGEVIKFEIDPFAKKCLLEGIDGLGYLLKQSERIAAYEKALTQSTRRPQGMQMKKT